MQRKIRASDDDNESSKCCLSAKQAPSKRTMGVIGEICPFRQKIIFQISTVLTILGDSQDLKPNVFKKICTFSLL